MDVTVSENTLAYYEKDFIISSKSFNEQSVGRTITRFKVDFTLGGTTIHFVLSFNLANHHILHLTFTI